MFTFIETDLHKVLVNNRIELICFCSGIFASIFFSVCVRIVDTLAKFGRWEGISFESQLEKHIKRKIVDSQSVCANAICHCFRHVHHTKKREREKKKCYSNDVRQYTRRPLFTRLPRGKCGAGALRANRQNISLGNSTLFTIIDSVTEMSRIISSWTNLMYHFDWQIP